jgi:hypothetical protein
MIAVHPHRHRIRTGINSEQASNSFLRPFLRFDLFAPFNLQPPKVRLCCLVDAGHPLQRPFSALLPPLWWLSSRHKGPYTVTLLTDLSVLNNSLFLPVPLQAFPRTSLEKFPFL